MAVDSTLILREVDTIVAQGEGIRQYQTSCQIRTPNEWISPSRITLLSLERDYETGYGDTLVIALMVGMGDYAYKLIPNRDQLFIDLSVTPQYRGVDSSGFDKRRKTRRYRAILINQENPGLVGRSPQSASAEDMNLTKIKKVEFQLIDEGLYQIRMASVGGIRRQVTTMDVLKSILTETTSYVDSNNQQQIFGVDVVEGFNNKVRQHVILPHGLPLIDVPSFLQNEDAGIYGAGLGCYLQDGFWRVFPRYDTTRWQKTPKALTVLNVPPNRYLGAERTYRRTANQIVVVGAGDMAVSDQGLHEQLNDGNALRFTNVDNLLDFGKTEGNKTTLTRKDNVFEFEATGLKSGMTHSRWAGDGATSNPFKHYTDIAQRNGRYVQVQWLHGDSSLLYPGMPVKFLASVNSKLATFYGVLLGAHDQRIPNEGGPTTTGFVASVTLVLFLSRLDTPV